MEPTQPKLPSFAISPKPDTSDLDKLLNPNALTTCGTV
jgi:hypothetical protein